MERTGGNGYAAEAPVDGVKALPKTEPRLKLISVGDLMKMVLPVRTPLFAWGDRMMIHKDALYLGDGLTRAGKGMLVGAALPVVLASGGGWGQFQAINPGRAVIVTVEDTFRRLQNRIGNFIRGLELDPSALEDRLSIIARPAGGIQLNNKGHVNELLDAILPYKPDYIYLDNLARMSEGDENTPEIRPAMEAVDTIREVTGAATILVHHWGKNNEGRPGVLKARGWSGIPAFAEAHLTVTRPEGSDTATLSHHDGKDDEDLALNFTLRKNGEEWSYDVAQTPNAASAAPDASRARVLDALTSLHRERRDGVPTIAIAARTGLSARTVGEHLGALKDLGAIRTQGKSTATRYYPAGSGPAGGL